MNFPTYERTDRNTGQTVKLVFVPTGFDDVKLRLALALVDSGLFQQHDSGDPMRCEPPRDYYDKIKMIKIVRSTFQIGLKDSKDVVDAAFQLLGINQ